MTANHALSELLGVQPAENISKKAESGGGTLYDLYQDGRILAQDELLERRAITTGQSVPAAEWEIRRKDGTVI